MILKLVRPTVPYKDIAEKVERYFGQPAKTSVNFSSRGLLDYDYIHKLSPEDHSWLNKFTKEYYLNMFFKRPLHRTKKLRLTVYDSANARRRTIEASDCIRITEVDFGTPSPEDALIEALDLIYGESNK